MCEPTPTKLPPHYDLADLIYKEMGIVVDPMTLRLFVRANWKQVQGLAHAIHEDKKYD